MARQDLAYVIAVNDAQLRLASQHVAAFNAELATSTVTGRKVDESFRAVGRRATQVGNFFLRNVTIPAGIAALATGKMAADFERSMAKISGLTNTTTTDTNRLSSAVLNLGSKGIIGAPKDLEDAVFRLQSVGFRANQTIAALPTIAKAAAAGLGSITNVADTVASALDAYGIAGQNAGRNALTASQATAVLIGTVTAGKVAPEQLANSIGRVIPVANAMGLSFDQVGASIASMTRQGLNANLAVTGLRSLLSQLARSQPTTQKALAAVGTSASAVREAIADPNVGLFATVRALRLEFEALGKHPVKIDRKTLLAGAGGDQTALTEIKSQVGDANQALAKLFPNIRALTAFLILTGPRYRQNASIFAQLKSDVEHSQDVVKRAYEAKLRTPIGQLELQLSKLQDTAVKVGPTFIKAGTGLLGFANGIFDAVHKLGPLGGVIKGLGLGLVLFGPVVSLFGRLAQTASLGVTMWGRWQTAATKAAYATQGINVEEDALLISTRKAAVAFDAGANQMVASANRVSTAVGNIGRSATGVRAQLAGASAGTAVFGKVSQVGRRPAMTSTATSAGIAPFSFATFARTPENIDAELGRTASANAQTVERATGRVTLAQEKLNAATAIGATGQVKQAAAELQAAKGVLAFAQQQEKLIFNDRQLITLSNELAAAQERLITQTATMGALGPGLAPFVNQTKAEVASLEQQIALRQRALAGGALKGNERAALTAVVPTGSFSNLADSEKQFVDKSASSSRIVATNWGAAMQGMRQAASLTFGLIGLTFATDVASKIIFSSADAKKHFLADMVDVHHSGVETFAAVGATAVLALTRIRQAGGGAGLAAGFRTLGIATLGWKGKLGLALAGVLGLQSAGVKLGSIYGSVMGIVAVAAIARLLRSARTAQVAVGGISSAGVSAGAAVAAGATEGTVALKAMTAQALEADAALASMRVSGGGVILPGGVGGVGGGLASEAGGAGGLASEAESVAKGGLLAGGLRGIGSKLLGGLGVSELFSGGIGGFFSGALKFGIGKVAIPLLVGQLVSQFFSQSSIRKIPVVGGVLTHLGFGHADAPKAATGAKAVDDPLFKQLEAGVPERVQRAAEALRTAGHEYAAEQLLAKERTDAQLKDVQTAVKFLKSHGKDELANVLDPVSKQIKAISHQFDALLTNISNSVLNAFDAHSDRLFDAFDQKTTALENKLKVSVKVPKLNETFTVTVNGKTPAERELDALDKVQEKQTFQRDIFDARQQLATAFQEGDPAAIRAAQRNLEDAKTEQRRFGLEKRATLERGAADKALAAGKDALDRQRAALRRDLTATRAVEHSQIDSALKAEQTMLDSGKISLSKYFADVQRIMRAHNVSIAQAGKDGGAAYAGQMQGYFDRLKTQIAKDLDAIQQKADDTANALEGAQKRLAKMGGLIGLLSQAPPGLKGLILTPADLLLPGGGDATKHDATVAASIAAKKGVPTRAALLDAVARLGVDAAERGNLVGLLPSSGRPTQRQVHDFLAQATPGERNAMMTSLKRGGYSRFATGGAVGGNGYGDIVPAMLAPGEVVLNAHQQHALSSMLGIGGVGPHGLFNFIRSQGARFAEGGVAGTTPTIPGYGSLSGVIAKLVKILQRSVVVQENMLRGNLAAKLDAVFAGTGTTRDPGILGKIATAQARRLREQLDPLNVIAGVNKTPGLASLPRDQKLALEARLSRMQAHPVLAGLFTPTPTGFASGGKSRLSTPHELPAGSGGFVIQGGITVIVKDVEDHAKAAQLGRVVADNVRRELQARGERNTPLRRTAFAGASLR